MKKLLGFLLIIAFLAGAVYVAYPSIAPMLSCKDLACAKQKDEWLTVHYNPQVPLFLSQNNSGDLLNTIEDADARDMTGVVMDQVAAPAYETMSKTTKPLTCAVVGNSSHLLGKGAGANIDAHSYVFRMENAPTSGYETDVGTRTTHHLLGFGSPQIAIYQPNTITVLSPPSFFRTREGNIVQYNPRYEFSESVLRLAQLIVPDTISSPHRHPKYYSTLKNVADTVNGGLLVLHPEFVAYIGSNWLNWKEPKPYISTELRSVVLALHLCDTIDIYGFGHDNEPQWNYYFDAQDSTAHQGEEPPDYQEVLLTSLAKRGVLTLHND